MKKNLAFFLALLFMLLAWSGCQKSGTAEETTTDMPSADAPTVEQTTEPAPEVILPPAQDEEKKLTVVADGKSEYVILYPKNDAACKAQAEQLQGWFEAAYGVTLPVAEDASVAVVADACEILIGKTNRSESALLYERVGRPQDYACCVIGEKIVLIGYDSAITQKAVNSFYASYLSNVQDAAKPMQIPATLDRMVEGTYGVSIGFCADKPLSKFNIVYPKDSQDGEYYVANLLRAHLYQKGKMNLNTKNDAGMATTKEIRIGAVNRTDKETAAADGFTVSVKSGNLYVVANDLFGYIAAEKYLTETLFAAQTPKNTLQEGFRYTGKATEKAPERTTEYRVIFYNVLSFGVPTAQRDDYAAIFTLAYSPDVVGFNEYVNYKMDDAGVLKDMLAKNGYAKAPAGNKGTGNNGESVLFYKTETTTLIEDKFVTFEFKDVETGNVRTSDLSAHVGVFESKITGERYIAAAVHFESNRKDDNASTGGKYYTMGVYNRKNQADALMEEMLALKEKYGGIPMLLGGDFNSPRYGRTIAGEKLVDACEHLIAQYGWQDCQALAPVTDQSNTSHNYPPYDEELGIYQKGALFEGDYSVAIDHIFQHGDQIKPRLYDTVIHDLTLVISDHFPLLLDFDIESSI